MKYVLQRILDLPQGTSFTSVMSLFFITVRKCLIFCFAKIIEIEMLRSGSDEVKKGEGDISYTFFTSCVLAIGHKYGRGL